jgi:hypothetical protein
MRNKLLIIILIFDMYNLMNKVVFLLFFFSAITFTLKAENVLGNFSKPVVGGYVIGRYQANDERKTSSNNTFSVRSFRLYASGSCFNDFFYKVQGELAGTPGEKSGPRLLDAYTEWQHWSFAKIKLGQFKRPFSFENPFALLDVGLGCYSQLTTKLAGLTDRNGEHTSNGRDAGFQVQGDFLKFSNIDHYFIHYQIGIFNGQGTNQTDKDDTKDLIGGIWINPIHNLRIGGFGWTGHCVNENYSGQINTLKKVERNRWSVGLDYESKWVVRSEYVASEGSCMTNSTLGNKSDAWYALCGVPVGEKIKIYGRWDCYRPTKEWAALNTNWDASFNYIPTKNLILQATLTHTDNRMSLINKHYNAVDLQVYVRF